MGCRKNSPGNPCCTCCGELTNPTGWTTTSTCCSICQRNITDTWTDICSAAIRSDTRTATVGIRMSTRTLDVITNAIQCVEDPPGSGIFVCSAGAGPLGACKASTVCGTTTYTQTTTQEVKLVARWKKTKQSSTLSRISTKCDAEGAATCKWLLISRMCITIEWGYKWFTTDQQDITNTSACCKATAISVSAVPQTCTSAASEMYLQNITNVCLTRSKYFTAVPSGIITLNPGDLANCDYDPASPCIPTTSPTAGIDTDQVTLTSVTTSSEIAWTAPSCVTTNASQGCQYTLKPNPANCSGASFEYDTSHMETISTVVVNGSILGQMTGVYPMQFLASCQGADYCTNWTIITKTECVALSSSRTDSGHTTRTIVISLPAWTVDLATCTDA